MYIRRVQGLGNTDLFNGDFSIKFQFAFAVDCGMQSLHMGSSLK